MHIHLMEGAVPRKVMSARRVPLRYEKEAEKTVDELVKKGVIVPATVQMAELNINPIRHH